MDKASIKLLFLFLLSILIVYSSRGSLFPVKNNEHEELARATKQTPDTLSRRVLIKTTQHDFTTFPTTPVTNPATYNPVTNPVTYNPITNPVPNPATILPPPNTQTPANPITVTPTPANPITSPVPVFNPVTTPNPGATVPGGPQPVTTYNPAPAGGGGGGVPAVAPPVTGNAPAVAGQSWCVARGAAPESSVQSALDYACGIGGADCSVIQMGGSCYNPNSLQSHASYAFNSYYQRNPVQTSCDFGGTAVITNVNPSSGSCIFTTWSPSSTSPTTMSPVTPTPSTESSSGATTPTNPGGATPTYNPGGATPTYSGGATPTSFGFPPPTLSNPTNPALGGGTMGYGGSPPTGSTPFSMSTNLQPFMSCIVMVTMTSIITRTILLDT